MIHAGEPGSCVAFSTQNFKPLLASLKTLQGTYVEKAVNLMGNSALITEMGYIYSLEFVKEAFTLSEPSDFLVSKAGILLQSVISRLKDAAETGNPIGETALRKFIEVYEKMLVSNKHFSFPPLRAQRNLC